MFRLLTILLSFLPVLTQQSSGEEGYDVFVPISKYMQQGDSEKLSTWFADNLEITVLSNSSASSRNQARQILKSFFREHTPTSFTIFHLASKSNMKYAIGTLVAGAETYQVTLFLNLKKDRFQIQQLKIERVR